MTATGNLAAALAYAERGWRVVPIIPGRKHPHFDAWQEVATTDHLLIDEWWSRWPSHGVGIATGARSGIFVVDVDVSGSKQGDETLADLEAMYGKLPETVEVVTGSGGRHLYFKTPEGVEISNDQAGRLGPGLDVRGEGGQVLAPPTIHPNGTAYQWEASSDPTDIDVAEAPAWLIELLTKESTSKPKRERLPAVEGETPGNLFAASITWPELLEQDGAEFIDTRKHRQSATTYEIWARPGCRDEYGSIHTGATLYFKGSDVLKVHTTSWGGVDPDTGEVWKLEADATYTRFGYYATRHHGGNMSAAAKDLAEQGFVPGVEEFDPEPQDPDEPWPIPVAIEEDGPPPPFPLEALPKWMGDHAWAVSDRLQVPVDLCAQLALGALSTMAMGHARVAVTSTWVEHVHLWLATAMHSGAGKSPADRAMSGVIRKYEEELRSAVEDDINRAEAQKRVAERNLKEAERKGSIEEIAELTATAMAIEVPPLPRLLADDATPEALTMIMSAHNGRMAIVSAEAEILDMVCGTYAANRSINLNVYLKGWSGDPIIVDRKGSNGKGAEHFRIPEAMITVSVTVQPSALAALAEHPELAGRGFLARFMYALPESLRGRRDRQRARVADSLGTEKAYEDALLTIGRRLGRNQFPIDLVFADDATDLFLDWLQDQEGRLGPGEDLEPIAEWVAKLQGSVARLAALLHLADGRLHPTPIDVATVRRAIAIGEYWIAHAKAVTRVWRPSPEKQIAAAVVRWLRGLEEVPEMVSLRDVGHAMKSTFNRRPEVYEAVENLRVPLQQLVDDGWLRTVDGGRVTIGGRGRPSQEFLISPHVAPQPQVVGAQQPPVGAHGAQSLRGEIIDLSLSVETSAGASGFAPHAPQLCPQEGEAPPPYEGLI